MPLHIEFTAGELSDSEAAGLMLLIAATNPGAETAIERVMAQMGLSDRVTITHAVGDISVTGTGTPEALDAAKVFAAPADAAFTAPLDGSTAGGAAAADGSTETQTLAAAAVAASPAPRLDVAVDADGWPHDTRIHSENPTLTTKGTWRARRFKTDADRKAAEATTHAELRAAGYGVPPAAAGSASSASAAPAPAASPVPAASSPPTPSAAPAAPVGGEPAIPPAEAVSAAAAPAPPPVPASPALPAELAPSAAAPTAPTADTAVNPMVRFTGIMQRVTAAQGEGKVTQDTVTSILQGLGLGSIRELATRADLMDGFEATFNAMAA